MFVPFVRGERLTYERKFYSQFNTEKNKNRIYGFPFIRGAWCNSLKVNALSQIERKTKGTTNKKINIVQYLGIAADEPERIKRHSIIGKVLPLVDIGWDEDYCRQWCEENKLLSPIYATNRRGGCWFCHNQSVDQLRLLRKNYPELWALLLKWDLDSPVTFKANGRTVYDYDKRFQAEDAGIIKANDKRFRWKQVLQKQWI